ncbi:hypothetical protein V6C27_05475 [Peptococcaceae bacterium 1198_IL3148]
MLSFAIFSGVIGGLGLLAFFLGWTKNGYSNSADGLREGRTLRG